MTTTTDITLYETGNGGDFAILNDDLQLGESLYQPIYLALFGGNVEANTKTAYLDSEERFDYWGNTLIWKDNKTKQFNSQTERVIKNTALNSSGRVSILQAINNDLDYLKAAVNFLAEVEILEVSKLKIVVTFSEKSNQEDKVLKLIFDNIKNEVIIEKII